MRIISNYHDYYDSLQKYGQDSSLIWIRKPEKVEQDVPFVLNRGNNNLYNYWSHKPSCLYYDSKFIGFCGKVYYCLVIKYFSDKSQITDCCYSDEDVSNFLERLKNEGLIKNLDWYETKKGFCRKTVEYTFSEYSNNWQTQFERYFIANKCPVFIGVPDYRNSYIVYLGRMLKKMSLGRIVGDLPVVGDRAKLLEITRDNTLDYSLSALQFYRLFDTQQTYQELSMYLSGVLGINNPIIPEMNDLVKRDQHGFDKFSFRKDKSK